MMDENEHKRICPVERAGGLDMRIRRLFQNPRKILKPYVKEGMTVLDLGCGPGFFTLEIVKLINDGTVIAADIQQGMLDILKNKIKGAGLETKIRTHLCTSNGLGITDKVNFILAFYMVHEVTDQELLFKELKSILLPGGFILIVEPNFHVSKKEFDVMVEKAISLGFRTEKKPSLLLSRSVVLTH